jgi:hypothetical protein
MIFGAEVSVQRTGIFHHSSPLMGAAPTVRTVSPTFPLTHASPLNRFDSGNHLSELFLIRLAGHCISVQVLSTAYV